MSTSSVVSVHERAAHDIISSIGKLSADIATDPGYDTTMQTQANDLFDAISKAAVGARQRLPQAPLPHPDKL